MLEPNCRSIVETKNLWAIAIDFMKRIDAKLMEFNLKYAYITYMLLKQSKVDKKTRKQLVFVACFNDVGKHYTSENSSNTLIETYLFLKYFSPLKNDAEILLTGVRGFKNPKNVIDYNRLNIAKKYTEYLIKTNDKNEALRMIQAEEKNYGYLDIFNLTKLVKKLDLFYEINSMHYKTVVYKFISKMMFSRKEKNYFFTMLSSLFEMYSPQTLYHSKVTAIIAYKLARCMKLKRKYCNKIYVAGLSHDLGKVCIQLKILEKPDKLTDREYSIMKKHVEYTKEILTDKMDYDIIEIAYRHHERMDGSGYPNKIKGNCLTMDQKILQVADVISALIAKRSYKEAWSIDKTIAILEDNVKNDKLSIDVVECFKQNRDRILKASIQLMSQAEKIYNKMNDEREELTKRSE
ncbi:MAG: HD domain-containing protein [Acholeplasmatales bacterium]|nr:HD domain-containing protein [Acholeplasmatales bacterium]